METQRIRATVAVILSSSMTLRTPVEPVAPSSMMVMSRRHDDHDAAEVQDGPEYKMPELQLQPPAPPPMPFDNSVAQMLPLQQSWHRADTELLGMPVVLRASPALWESGALDMPVSHP